jgi:hypothetical protein
MKFDVVSKAEHYNSHPSGIEAKHILRGLNFNVGNATKYVMRRHGKEYERSLKSAEFYLRDQLEHSPTPLLVVHVIPLLEQYAAAEVSVEAKEFYKAMVKYLNKTTASNLVSLITTLVVLQVSGT